VESLEVIAKLSGRNGNESKRVKAGRSEKG